MHACEWKWWYHSSSSCDNCSPGSNWKYSTIHVIGRQVSIWTTYDVANWLQMASRGHNGLMGSYTTMHYHRCHWLELFLNCSRKRVSINPIWSPYIKLRVTFSVALLGHAVCLVKYFFTYLAKANFVWTRPCLLALFPCAAIEMIQWNSNFAAIPI